MLDLARWPPFQAARQILGLSASGDDPFLDPGVPQELVPTLGRHPTEKYAYSAFVLNQDDRREANEKTLDIAKGGLDPSVAWSVEGARPQLRIGARLDYEQAWTPLALALGNVLHSVALGPGESTNIAVIDWSRRERFASSEGLSEADHLQNLQGRSRALNEVTDAVATETLTGSSSTETISTTDTTAASSQGFSSGASQSSSSTNNVEAATASSTSGEKDVASSMAQTINDTTSQHAASSRNGHATVVRETLQTQSETLTTRNVTNYNHMHALTIEYFEVVQIYQAIVALTRITACLFLPVEPIQNWTAKLLDRYHRQLVPAALGPGIRNALTFPAICYEIAASDRVRAKILRASSLYSTAQKTPSRKFGGGSELLGIQLHDAQSEAPLSLPGNTLAFRIFLTDGRSLDWVPNQAADPIALKDIEEIRLVPGSNFPRPRPGPRRDEAALVAVLRVQEPETSRSISMPVIVNFDLSGAFEDAKRGVAVADVSQAHYSRALLKHFKTNGRHYNAAILSQLDVAGFAGLLECYRVKDVPLLDLVDPLPLANTGSHLVFRLIDPDHTLFADSIKALRAQVLGDRAAEFVENGQITLDERRVPMPTGGSFVEAVQGRANSAEKIDLTRWWNWQDSSIPLSAPEIAALEASSRRADLDLTAGGLSSALVQLTEAEAEAEDLPAPESLAKLVTALGNANLFDDLTGLDEAIAAAQAALTQAVTLSNQTGEQSSANLAAGLNLTADAVDQMVGIITKFTTTLVSAGTTAVSSKPAPGAPTQGGDATSDAPADAANNAGSDAPASDTDGTI